MPLPSSPSQSRRRDRKGVPASVRILIASVASIDELPMGVDAAIFSIPQAGVEETLKAAVARALEQYDRMSGVWVVGEDLAQEQNRITLHDSEVDQYGLPVPIVAKTPHNNDTEMVNHAYEVTAEIYESVGATDVYELPAYPATHNMGTNRMHADPSKGVVNAYGQSHDIANLFVSDGSQFTSSGACNPTLTIVALAIRQAEYIAREMSANNI